FTTRDGPHNDPHESADPRLDAAATAAARRGVGRGRPGTLRRAGRHQTSSLRWPGLASTGGWGGGAGLRGLERGWVGAGGWRGRGFEVVSAVAEQPGLGFAGLLRQLRAEAKLTQEELAEAAGLSARSVSDWERGIHRTAHKDTAGLLADALGLAEPARA